MAYSYATIASGQQIDADILHDNFEYLDPTGTASDLNVGGDITISGNGSDAQLNFLDSSTNIDVRNNAELGENAFNFSHAIYSDNDIMSNSDFISNGELYLKNNDTTGDTYIYTNDSTQSFSFRNTRSAWVASESLEIRGRSLRIGTVTGSYASGQSSILFTPNANSGTGDPGVRINYSTNKLEGSHTGGSWLPILLQGDSFGTTPYADALQIDPYAYDYISYTGEVHAIKSAGGNYVTIDPGESPSSPSIDFSVSGYESASIVYDGTVGSDGVFIMNAPLTLKRGGSDPDLYTGDIQVGYQQSTIKMYFGPQAPEPAYFEVDATNSYGRFYVDTIRAVGDFITDGGNYFMNNAIAIGYAYGGGDQDCTIWHNQTAEYWRMDYGRDASIFSNPELWIGDGTNEDIWLRFYNNATISGLAVPYGIKFDTSDSLFYATDASGTYLLSANVSGYLGSVGTFDQVTDNGATTTNDVTAASFRSNGPMYINFDGPDGDSYLFFYENSAPNAEYLAWIDADDNFLLSDSLEIDGRLKVDSTQLYMGYGLGGDASQTIYFFDGGSQTGEYIRWADANNWFYFSNDIYINGELQCKSLRINVSPTAGTPSQTHTAPVNINGTTYYALLSTSAS